MGLKDLESIHDLVPGTGPVSNMEGAQGPSFDLGSNSTLQVDSLQIVPQFSLYQDLNILSLQVINFALLMVLLLIPLISRIPLQNHIKFRIYHSLISQQEMSQLIGKYCRIQDFLILDLTFMAGKIWS